MSNPSPVFQSYMVNSGLDQGKRPLPGACHRCRSGHGEIERHKTARGKGGIQKFEVELLCISCYWNPNGLAPEAPKVKRARVHPYTRAEAEARAVKVGNQLCMAGFPDIYGDDEIGFRVIPDSPLVEGFKPAK